MRQKGRSQKGGNEKTKHAKISKKTNISYPLIRTHSCTYQRIRKAGFFGKFGALCYRVTYILRFAILPYYRQIKLPSLLKLFFFFSQKQK